VTPEPTLRAELDAAIEASDPERVRDLIVGAKEKERRAAAGATDPWRVHSFSGTKEQAAKLAWIGTATARELGTWSWFVERVGLDDLTADVLAARGRAFLGTVARSLRGDDLGAWPLLRLAVRRGLIERPETEAWTRGLVSGIGGPERHANLESVYLGLLEDSELLEDEVWRLFEVDCGTELSNATAWVAKVDDRSTPGWDHGANRWTYALTRLADEKRLERDRLLDASLDALTRDFRPSMVGWYAGFHEALEPSEEERTARIERYLALLTSPVPAVVNAGLAALRAVETSVPADGLAHAASSALTLPQKKAATEVLRLLRRAVERDPQAGGAVLETVAQALGHERADVQETALRLLERYPDDAPRGALLGHLETVSATLRSRVEALVGIDAAEPEVEHIAAFEGSDWPEPVRPNADDARRSAAALEPVASVDELIELAAMLLEGEGDGDAAERFLDGVSRLCHERSPGFDRRTAGLLKQAGDSATSGFGHSGQSLVAALVRAWTGRRWKSVGLAAPTSVLGFLAHRVLGVAERAARRYPRPLLAFPTHAGGWIDPDALAERERRVGRIRNRPEPVDRLQAALRAQSRDAVCFARDVREHKAVWGSTSRSVTLRPTVPEGLGALGPAVAALGTNTSGYWWQRTQWAGFDALGVRWCLTVLPAQPEIAFAGAAMSIADAELIGGGVNGQPEAVLAHGLNPSVPLGAPAWLAVGAALLAKSPDVQRVGTDMLVATISDGRFDPEAAGEALAWLAENGVGKTSRLAVPLRDVGRLSPLHGAQTVRLLGSFLRHLTATPNALQAVLEAVLEHGTRVRYGVEDESARAALERIAAEVSRSSKLARNARALLELPVAGPARAGLVAAAEGVAARA
jgi:hypothetical protein